ncbi:MAG: metallophosphoesterase [Rhodoferax sp.]|nr:metallophosphoesterase [Rhodoferax sp.]MBP9928303.1 metallophosphoesterase [Rhodoferax sp.]HQZ07899.1 metallophosphoesterase [Burkholderiaceae bacterium]HRA61378.1 metallophosphoesterase [Burkholderiaceae bacterium]
MKIALMSDLHLSVQPMVAPHIDADVLVLAGDLHRPAGAIAWARQFGATPTLFVAGNHEFYGADLIGTMHALRTQAEGSSVRVLEQDVWYHQGVRFLGCTLWSDYRLFDSAEQREQGLQQAAAMVRDFSRIRVAADFDDLFTPAVAQLLFDRSVAWLERQLAVPHQGPTVVITHFAPSRGSIATRFVGSPLNACFVSDLQAQIERWQPALWLHGHVHDSCDYQIGRTRVVANPRGYAPKGVVENPRFDPSLVIELA